MAQAKDRFNTNKILRLITGLAAVDGVICLLWLVLIPSNPQSAWLLGYSSSRILLLMACVIGICFFAGLFLWISLDSERAIKISGKLEAVLPNERLSTTLVVICLSLLILSLVYLIFACTNLDYRVPSDAVTSMEQVKMYMYRLAPFALWSALLCGQVLLALNLLEYATTKKYLLAVQVLSIIIWPVLLAIFWGVNKIDPYYYVTLTKEDNFVEWATVFFFLLTGVLSFFRAFRCRNRFIWFYLIFGLACFLFALEEISWGQRIFGLESANFFVENSDQQEINVHNVINEWFSIRTKHVAAFVLFIYGAVLPLAELNHRVRLLARKLRVLVPPLILVPGFALATFLTVDLFFTGQDEEVAELFFSILLFLTITFQYLDPSGSDL